MKCPLCKYEPKLNKDGGARKGYLVFNRISISHDFKNDYTSSQSFVSYSCPKCGILFQKVNEEN